MKTLKEQGLRRSTSSAYFQGRFERYGANQWEVKAYCYDSQNEMESAQFHFLGEHVQVGKKPSNGNTLYGFELISELLERPIESHLAGRSGGWLVIDSDLTEAELLKVDAYIDSCLKALPEFLKEERAYRKEEEENAAKEEQDTRSALMKDKRIQEAMKLLKEVSPSDFVLVVKGLNLTQKENL